MKVSSVREDELFKIFSLEQSMEGESAASLETLQVRQQMFGAGFLAARKDDRIIGYLESCLWNVEIPEFQPYPGYFANRHCAHGKTLYIIFMGVDCDFRRQGVASTLLQAVAMAAYNSGAERVHAVTFAHLLPLYIKMGFKEVQAMPHFLPNLSDLILVEL